ncbi:MAG: hypothetical protein AABY62_08045 [Pseudomonadota bacterium]
MKYIYSVAAALFALIFAVNTHASCLGSPAAMKELCESGGGALEVTKGAHVCRWGNAGENHFVRLDCTKCLKGCNADGPLSKAGFEKLGIQDPSGRAQAQTQQIRLYSQLQRRQIIKTSE